MVLSRFVHSGTTSRVGKQGRLLKGSGPVGACCSVVIHGIISRTIHSRVYDVPIVVKILFDCWKSDVL